MDNKIKVIENSFLYTLCELLTKAIGFLLLPVYTLYLTPYDYGIINIINAFNGVATYIIAFSLYSCINRFYVEYKEDTEILKRFFGTIITFTSISGVIFILVGFIFQEYVSSCFFNNLPFFPYIATNLISLLFICLYTIHLSIIQAMQQGKKLFIRNILVFLFNVALNILFIGLFKLGAQGVLLASLIIYFLYMPYMLFDLLHNNLIILSIDKNILKEALKYSIPIMPHNLSTHIASYVSRLFIGKNESISSVGLYGVAWQFGNVIDIVQTSVKKAFIPWFFEAKNKNDDSTKKEIINLTQFLLILYSLMYMIIGLFSQEVIMVLTNEKYIMAWVVIPILVIAFSVKSIYYFYVNLLFYDKMASKKVFIATVSGSLIDIIFAYILVPKFGMYGSATAFLLAKIIIVAIVVFMSRKYNDVGYSMFRMLSIIIPSLLFMFVGLCFSYTKYISKFSWINLLYKFIVLMTYLIFLYLTNKQKINYLIKNNQIKRLLSYYLGGNSYKKKHN